MRNKNAETRITNCVMEWLQYVLFKTTRILQLWMGGARSIAATPLMHFSQNGWNQKTRMTSLRYYETNIIGDHLFA